jgi:HAD superfamily hydrolase (TIGR01662 family)
MMNLNIIDRSWTLFLDRDGVINEERLGKYVLNWQEFLFTDGTLNALAILSQKFGRLIIVSNQRGVGKGKKIEAAGGRIDKIFYCTETDDNCFNRKPNPGMALQAFKEFPDIDPAKSIIIGNKPSDMLFGRSAGMYTVFVTTTNPAQPFPHPDIDFIFPSLSEFAMAIKS